MANFAYNEGLSQITTGTVNWGSDTIKIRLIASTATPSINDTSLATGYTGIGTDQTLASKTQTKDTSNNRIVFNAANPTWISVSGGSTIGFAVVYKDDSINGIPIALLDVINTATTGGNVAVTFDATGIFYTQQ